MVHVYLAAGVYMVLYTVSQYDAPSLYCSQKNDTPSLYYCFESHAASLYCSAGLPN